jgi:hypothetical protein
MSTGTQDFEKLRKLLKLKRHEQPPPGYFSRFSTLVITRLEKEGEPEGVWLEVPWLKKLFGLLESSPMVAGLFGSAVCALVIVGITVANQPVKTSAVAFAPANSGVINANSGDTLAFNATSRSETLSRSTDPMFGSSVLGSPFSDNGSVTARLEPVSFSPTAP